MMMTEITDRWLYYLLVGIYFMMVVGCVASVLKENRNPVRSIAWVIALSSFPREVLWHIFSSAAVSAENILYPAITSGVS